MSTDKVTEASNLSMENQVGVDSDVAAVDIDYGETQEW